MSSAQSIGGTRQAGPAGSAAQRVPRQHPQHRYTAESLIRGQRQDRWGPQRTFQNPAGRRDGSVPASKLYLLDMFPYGAGLHVGHPLGYIGTDVLGRFQRMNGVPILSATTRSVCPPSSTRADRYPSAGGADGEHRLVPRAAAAARLRSRSAQISGHHGRRKRRWTQWIFLQLFNSWTQRARPIDDLVGGIRRRYPAGGADWTALDSGDRQRILAASGWPVRGSGQLASARCCSTRRSPLTAGRRSATIPFRAEPVAAMMRITAYADRLATWTGSTGRNRGDAAQLDGRSVGTQVVFPVISGGSGGAIEVYTTRPDTRVRRDLHGPGSPQ